MRYAAYIRSSTDEPETPSPVDLQRQAIETWVAAQGGELVEVYVDDHHSGLEIDRPALQEMIQDAQGGEFDTLVVQRLDRLSRKQAVVDKIHRALSACNINIFAVREREVYA